MIISLFRTFLCSTATPLYRRPRRSAPNPALLLALALSLTLVLAGCGSGGGSIPVPTLTAGTPFMGSGAGSVDLPIADPIAKVYAISVVSDTITDDATMRGEFTIALDDGDQDKRLRNLCSSPLASDGAIGDCAHRRRSTSLR